MLVELEAWRVGTQSEGYSTRSLFNIQANSAQAL